MSQALLNVVAIVHLVTCVMLAMLVLLQDPKGGAAGGIFGGGSNSLLSATGGTTFLAKLTRYTAIGFATLCLVMVYILAKGSGSILDKVELPAEPSGTLTAPASPGEAAAPTAAPAAPVETAPAAPPAAPNAPAQNK
ncbi:MAG: preprotein translocase subunit SecG [Bdellovibrionaceae bacterium]|nr:preprotein translocase subunit SecG [Pseudobdellovibrionaceae bacterium]